MPANSRALATTAVTDEILLRGCRAVGRNARLREHVTTVNFECRSAVALLHHPFRPLLVGVDERGTVRVYNHRHSTFVNAFHLANDRPTSVVGCWQLNEAQACPLIFPSRHYGIFAFCTPSWQLVAPRALQQL